jgi:ankyrin repeat protein
VIKELLQSLEGPDDSDVHKYMLAAVEKGCVAVVEALMSGRDRGAVNERDDDGDTPLHIASGEGMVEMVEALLRGGADASIRNDLGKTALKRARDNDEIEIVAAVEAHLNGALIDATSSLSMGDGRKTNLNGSGFDEGPPLCDVSNGESRQMAESSGEKDASAIFICC